jgi:DNA-binding response OmpR family regulator
MGRTIPSLPPTPAADRLRSMSDRTAEHAPLHGALSGSTHSGTALEGEEQRAYVLEDDPDIAALEADILRDLGFGVITCTRIVELGDLMALAMPHLLVVDVMLPDGDGGDITELLRRSWPGIPVVFVSAATRERLAELAPLAPVVAKPFDVATFAAAVEAAVGTPRELRTAS